MNFAQDKFVTVSPVTIQGNLLAPASKSVSQRVVAAALVKGGTTILKNYGSSNDELIALEVLKQLGCDVALDPAGVTIQISTILKNNINVYFGESGLSCRLFSMVLSFLCNDFIINVDPSLAKRPMTELDNILQQSNANIEHLGSEFFPLKISNAILNNYYSVNGAISSQFLTGLVFALAGQSLDKIHTIEVHDLVSKPYIDITLDVLHAFELNVPEHTNYSIFRFSPATIVPKTIEYTIEGDWSNAAFFLVAGAIAGKIKVTGLDVFSKQGDKSILTALMDAGVKLSITTERINVSTTGNKLHAFQFDATECPDLFPPLVVLASRCEGTSVIKGVKRLFHKESNRAETLVSVFRKLSIEIEIQDDLLIIKGGIISPTEIIEAPNDHRIVMAIAVAALQSEKPITIKNWEAVSKSYPKFFTDLQNVGGIIAFHGGAV